MDRRHFLTALLGAPAIAAGLIAASGTAAALPVAPMPMLAAGLADGVELENASWASQGANRVNRQIFGHRRRRGYYRRRTYRRRYYRS